jgi:hypothetical protein
MPIESTQAIRDGLERAHWGISDLWVAALGVGGSFTRPEVEQIVEGRRPATRTEHDILAAALNDHFTGLGENHPIRYWRQLDRARP